MASESEMPEPSLIERLISSRNRDLSLFLPFILGFTNNTAMGSESDPREGLENPDHETMETPISRGPRDRIILINPLTQEMVVIEGISSSLDSLLRDLLNKDGQPPASKASIEAMPDVEIKDGDDDGECVICLEEWGDGDVAKEMPCKHRFHGECVEKWLKIHGSCPVCRYKMPVDEDQDLIKKIGGGEERRERRTQIWVSFSFNGERGNGDSNQTASTDTNDSS